MMDTQLPNTHAAPGGPTLPRDWLDYGEIDPLENPAQLLHPCRRCGAMPGLCAGPPNAYGRATTLAVCACGKAGPTSDQGFGAVLAWNMRPQLAMAPNYPQLPFFFLAELSPVDALLKLQVIKRHLVSRIDVSKRRVDSGISSGKPYRHRLQAYMGWCIHSMKCVEHALHETKPRRVAGCS